MKSTHREVARHEVVKYATMHRSKMKFAPPVTFDDWGKYNEDGNWHIRDKGIVWPGLYFSNYGVGCQRIANNIMGDVDEDFKILSLKEVHSIYCRERKMFCLEETQIGYNYDEGSLLVRHLKRDVTQGGYDRVTIENFEFVESYLKNLEWVDLSCEWTEQLRVEMPEFHGNLVACLRQGCIYSQLRDDERARVLWQAIGQQVQHLKCVEQKKYRTWDYKGPLTSSTKEVYGQVYFRIPDRIKHRYLELKDCSKIGFGGKFQNGKALEKKGLKNGPLFSGSLHKDRKEMREILNREFLHRFNELGGIRDFQHLDHEPCE